MPKDAQRLSASFLTEVERSALNRLQGKMPKDAQRLVGIFPD